MKSGGPCGAVAKSGLALLLILQATAGCVGGPAPAPHQGAECLERQDLHVVAINGLSEPARMGWSGRLADSDDGFDDGIRDIAPQGSTTWGVAAPCGDIEGIVYSSTFTEYRRATFEFRVSEETGREAPAFVFKQVAPGDGWFQCDWSQDSANDSLCTMPSVDVTVVAFNNMDRPVGMAYEMRAPDNETLLASRVAQVDPGYVYMNATLPYATVLAHLVVRDGADSHSAWLDFLSEPTAGIHFEFGENGIGYSVYVS